MAIELVTGYHGKDHVTAEQMADFNCGIFGDAAILDVGNKLEASIQTANRITIKDGVAVFNGREVYIGYGKNETVNITSGTQGMKRYDIIAVVYEKDARTGVEKVTLKAITGTPNATRPADPQVNNLDIRTGVLKSEKPLYRVCLNGTAIESIDRLVEVKGFQKHAFSPPVKILNAPGEGYALDAVAGKELKKLIDALSVRVQNHFSRTGATAYSGNYKSQWTLTTQYQDIGNTISWDDTYYKISPGSTEITVKEGGLYIITASITVKADNYNNIWMKILKNGAEEHTMITVANGYTTVQCCASATLTTNDKISVQLAKSSEGVNVTCDGGGYLQLIKLI